MFSRQPTNVSGSPPEQRPATARTSNALRLSSLRPSLKLDQKRSFFPKTRDKVFTELAFSRQPSTVSPPEQRPAAARASNALRLSPPKNSEKDSRKSEKSQAIPIHLHLNKSRRYLGDAFKHVRHYDGRLSHNQGLLSHGQSFRFHRIHLGLIA